MQTTKMRNKSDGRRMMRTVLQCPACNLMIRRDSDEELARPEAGQLSQCEHCNSYIEYAEDASSGLLTIRRADWARVRMFRTLAQKRNCHLASILEYVLKYHRMPSSSRNTSFAADCVSSS